MAVTPYFEASKSDSRQKQYVGVTGGLLVQDADLECKEITEEMTVTERKPSAAELADMNFGWRVVKHVKSNAIVVVKNGATVGVGAGQMNRVGSAEIALEEAKAAGHTEGLVLASDGFLPFDAFRKRGNTRVAGRAIYLINLRAARQSLHDCMFSAAAAYNKNFFHNQCLK